MRIPISTPKNIWFNARNVDDEDLTLEQQHNEQNQAAIVNNQFGSGVIPEALLPHILFDSATITSLLDGKALFPQAQPSDNNLGNQLEVELSGSKAAGKRTVKVLVIGLDFQNNLQFDALTFNRNELQTTSKHYRSLLMLMTNDLIGVNGQSFNLGGRVIVRETSPIELSRDCKMIAQDTQPNLFFRDFFVGAGTTLVGVLSAALPSFSVDSLGITSGFKQLRSIVENDVSSQIGQKFLASTNNVQKITLLLSVVNNLTPNNLVWTGDLLISIYQLQSMVACPSDIVPQLAIDFDPSNVPLAQLSVNYTSLLNAGVVLNTVPQPVDFVFSNTGVGSGLLITPGNYYAVSVKRAGSPDTCQIQLATGVNTSSIQRETLFNGNIWTDVPEESLWFQVWTDAAKVSDGQAYDAGHGVQVPKVQIDPTTQLTKDFSLGGIQFVRNDVYNALLQADTEQLVQIQDERTGEPVFSQQQFVPEITLLNALGLANIQNVDAPLVLGTITDQNVKAFNPAAPVLTAAMHEYGMVGNQIVFKVITDPTDGYRYDQNIIELVSELVEGNLNGAKFTPNVANPSVFYRIARAELLTLKYGDIDGNCVIDTNDLLISPILVGTDLNTIPTQNQYITNITPFVNDANLIWQLIDPNTLIVIASGANGVLTVNPNDGSLANFKAITANFNSIANLGNLKLVISNATSSQGNNGTFSIVNLIDNTDITIQKLLYTSETILEALRSDVSNDMIIDTADINTITNYINLLPPFPSPTSPGNRVGTTFNAIRLTVEEFVDRADDYPSSSTTRNASVHTVPDIYLDGASFFSGTNLKTNPITFSIAKQLVWNEASVVVNSNPRMIPASFVSQNGFVLNDCEVNCVQPQVFPQKPLFDPGRNDFFLPNNLIINAGGQIISNDGYFYKLDVEVGTITLEIPDISFDAERTLNILTDFVADFTGQGFTRIGYPAMKFADCSNVGLDALFKNQIRFDVAVQSFSPQLNGIDGYCIEGIIVDNKIGVSIDYSSGLLTLNFTNLYQDPVKQTLNTKIQITVYLKKAGWNNTPIFVSSTKTQNILGLTTPPPSPIVCPDPPVVIIA